MQSNPEKSVHPFRPNANQLAVMGFMGLIVLGALLLMLPISSRGESLNLLDALFTATSAVCVTGLTVVDTGTHFTGFGQAVILILIQAGGLGIMILTSSILFMLGKRLSLTLSDGVSGAFLPARHISMGGMIKITLAWTFLFELTAAVILFARWAVDFSPGKALWLAIFHSVSAFCNAGFSLFPDSLSGYVGDPLINGVIMALIICGGIGFFVMIDFWVCARSRFRPGRRLSFHSRIVLTATLFLIFFGALALWAIEHNHNLQGLSLHQSIMRSLFQSVTARTAGFNTMEIPELANASLFLLIMLMFIGGAPGSTAGGIKVTAASVLVIAVRSRLQGMQKASWAGRSLSRADLERALVLILLSGALVGLITMLLLITELGGAAHTHSRGLFLELLFESVSAFGTVGLTTGVTPSLTPTGRLLVIFAMFIGRLGPFTLVYAMESRREPVRMQFPEEKIMIG
ncbi:TrkH family potassium uptake protein [Desulfatibacillum aliphaticivorans]|uniref:TrkH family potassium uptake protein n=1 Tax=Desulfatibacillum aliphaticivorans TaxID=218208 RepID=UPI000418E5BE|nr:TrkH family potassium uptake protein [Desulfatibacillum aliphaticivorans]